MPAYDFRCVSCRHVFEVTRPSSDTTPLTCPLCGAETKRIFNSVGIHFKGTGFHNTDYKKAAASPAEPKKSEAPTSEPSCPAAPTGGCANCPAASGE
jgi:putative FmdB family regulatory protein